MLSNIHAANDFPKFLTQKLTPGSHPHISWTTYPFKYTSSCTQLLWFFSVLLRGLSGEIPLNMRPSTNRADKWRETFSIPLKLTLWQTPFFTLIATTLSWDHVLQGIMFSSSPGQEHPPPDTHTSSQRLLPLWEPICTWADTSELREEKGQSHLV